MKEEDGSLKEEDGSLRDEPDGSRQKMRNISIMLRMVTGAS